MREWWTNMKDENTIFLKKVALFIRTYLESNSLEQCKYLKYNEETNEFEVVENIKGFSKYVALDIFRILKNLRAEKIPFVDQLGNELEDFISSEQTFVCEEIAATRISDEELTNVELISKIYNTISAGFSYYKETQGQVLVEEQLDVQVDNVVMLQSIYDILNREAKVSLEEAVEINDAIKEKLFNVILDLSNVEILKYNLVKNPVYHRRIHNGQRFNSPFMLVYWLCKIQREFQVLNNQGETVIKRIINDGYTRLQELKSYEIGLLLSSTPLGYEEEVQAAKNELFKRVNEDGSWIAEGIILESTDTMLFLGSKLYTTAICVEGLCVGGTKGFGDFHHEKIKISNAANHISKEISIDKDRFMDFKSNKIYMTIEDNYMKPTLEKKDEIQVELSTEAEKDDIVIFINQRGELLAHRVTEVIEAESEVVFITCTEDKNEFGYPVFKRNTIGKVININKFTEK